MSFIASVKEYRSVKAWLDKQGKRALLLFPQQAFHQGLAAFICIGLHLNPWLD